MGARKHVLGTVVALLAAGLAMVPARAATGPGRFLVGAARVDITPPMQPSDFPGCPPSVFTGERRFAFEEPYVDVQHLGHYEYPDPFCDANGNGRYDGVYLSGGVDVLAQGVHDPIDARALAINDVVIVSVVSQGLFENYTTRIREEARRLRPGIADVLVSANHNESSPDPIGIYGAPDTGQGFGLRSGIDDYYMDFLVDRAAHAAAAAFDARRPATLVVTQVAVPPTVRVALSDNFPTTGPNKSAAAVDPKLGILIAHGVDGRTIATVMSLAAHNQEIGHSGSPLISSDWPGAFASRLESRDGGMAMFLVGDNGSIEDPQTVPPVRGTAFDQADATGVALADLVASASGTTSALRAGPVRLRRDRFDVPLENNLFKAAFVAGIFGQRQASGLFAFRTSVAVVDVGPELQLLANPGEAFPAIMLGSPWGRGDASCPDRPNPPVPTWHASARWRFQVGLADDMIGYLLPPWAFATQPGVYLTTCTTDANDRDSKGHQHKLEDESVGPTAGALVAEHLTALLGPGRATITAGRFVRADSSLSGSPIDAVGVRLADGEHLTGTFVDFDGASQAGPDVNTRGISTGGNTVFVDVYS